MLPLLLYGAPVWCKAMTIQSYKAKLIRVQRIINIKIAKAYRTLSNEALCVLTGLTPITIKIKEASQYYNIIRGCKRENIKVVTRMGPQTWQHPAETIILLSEKKTRTKAQFKYTLTKVSQKRE
jgi:hypothetical protein